MIQELFNQLLGELGRMDKNKNVYVTQEGIRREIEILLCTRFEVPKKFIQNMENEEGLFFGVRSLIGPRDLVYLVYLLEKQYNICFGEAEYDNPKFYSLAGLSEIIANMISTQKIVRRESNEKIHCNESNLSVSC